jgi:hypothetical protein
MLCARLASAVVRRSAKQKTEAELYRYVRVQRRFAPLIDHLAERHSGQQRSKIQAKQ